MRKKTIVLNGYYKLMLTIVFVILLYYIKYYDIRFNITICTLLKCINKELVCIKK